MKNLFPVLLTLVACGSQDSTGLFYSTTSTQTTTIQADAGTSSNTQQDAGVGGSTTSEGGAGGQAQTGGGGQGGTGGQEPDAGPGGAGGTGETTSTGGQGGTGGAEIVCPLGKADCDNSQANGCETDTTQDPGNCGGCGKPCDAPAGTQPVCQGSICKPQCLPGYSNCNGDWLDGCEVTPASDPQNCGGCDTVCSSLNGTPTCIQGVCGTTCLPGFADCTGSSGCETTTGNDTQNCGACGNACKVDNGVPGCVNGACVIKACGPYSGNCDGNDANGCETDIRQTENCGGCGKACNPVTQICQNLACTSMVCPAGQASCDGNAANGCETTLGTLQDCTGCGDTCQAEPNSVPQCSGNGCGIQCLAGFLDCNKNQADGCEINLKTDALNCGQCGLVCPVGGSCQAGACQCPGVTPKSCGGTCRDLSQDIQNCGACGTVCQSPNSTPSCLAGQCSFLCQAGFLSCDGQQANGCEINATNDPKNCGACGHDCQGGSCTAGQCGPVLLQKGGNPVFVVDNSFIYTPGKQSIQKMSVNGGAQTQHCDLTPNGVTRITVDASGVYVTARAGGVSTVLKCALGGGSYTTLYSTSNVAAQTAITLDAQNVYWTTDGWGTGTVNRVPKGGGASTKLAAAQDFPIAVAVNLTHVFWANRGTVNGGSKDGSITRTPISGGAVQTLALNQFGLAHLAANETRVYWTTADGTVMLMPVAGGQQTMIAGGQQNTHSIGIDATHVYWTNLGMSQKTGTLMRANLDGSNLVTLASGLDGLGALALNATAIFYKDVIGFWKVAK